MDNVTAADRDQGERDNNAKSFLAAIRRRNFALNESKTIVSQKDIQILGYVVGNGIVKPDPERMRALNEFPPPNGYKSHRRVLGIFVYYAKWIGHFAEKVRPLAEAKNFPLSGDTLNFFKL